MYHLINLDKIIKQTLKIGGRYILLAFWESTDWLADGAEIVPAHLVNRVYGQSRPCIDP